MRAAFWFPPSGKYGKLPAGGEYAEELTAAGYGEPGFYAYYPNCRNVFGFHDDMDGVIKVEERIHRDTFQPLDGGVQWDLKKKEGAAEAQTSVRIELENSLKRLNSKETLKQKIKGRLEKYRKDAYFAWFQYQANAHSEIKELAVRQWSALLENILACEQKLRLETEAAEGEFERVGDLYISEQMDSNLYENTMVLTPRLLQPSRLSFQWVNKQDGVIFGWLAPNCINLIK